MTIRPHSHHHAAAYTPQRLDAFRTLENGGVPGPLVVSIVASVVLTIVLNLALRLFPGIAERLRDRLAQTLEADEQRQAEARPSNVRVIVPWKLMLIASLALTLVLNVVLLLRR